jgi:hypothetical protein
MRKEKSMKIKILAALIMMSLAQSDDPAIKSRRLLVALEGGGAVTLDPRDGKVLARHATGLDAFGAAYSFDGRRAFVTDKQAGALVEIGGERLEVGRGAQQPAVTPDGRIYIALSGEAAIAVVQGRAVVRRIDSGKGTKPHIISLSPDGHWLWATVQGADPRVIAIEITPEGEKVAREFRYDLVPRVISAVNDGAWFTAHHSTGLHFASLADGKVTTPFLDENGPHSEPRKQIEGVAASPDGRRIAITHEGRRALLILDISDGKARREVEAVPLADNPYWVSLDPSLDVAYVSIPAKGLVEAYSLRTSAARFLWRAEVGGKPKRMAVSQVP